MGKEIVNYMRKHRNNSIREIYIGRHVCNSKISAGSFKMRKTDVSPIINTI